MPKTGSVGYCVQDSGEVVVVHSSGQALWSTAMPGSVMQGTSAVKQQLISHSSSQMRCMLNQQVLAHPYRDYRLTASSPMGKLQVTSGDGSRRFWSTQQYSGVRQPYGLCIKDDGALQYTAAGGAQRLWNRTAAPVGTAGPFTLLVCEASIEVSCVCCLWCRHCPSCHQEGGLRASAPRQPCHSLVAT
jgi:hypothetical protein